MSFLNYIPLATFIFCGFFFIELLQHWRKFRQATHLLWWIIGIFFYGMGTLTEAIHAILGYYPANFKLWYICGALLGAAPLAQGTVYLLLKRRTANILSVILSLVIAGTAILVILSPLKPVTDPAAKLSGNILEWTFIRYMTPFINSYALLFLVGGAIYSAVLYHRDIFDRSRFWGNVLIAIGGLLPAIGGTLTKFGHIEALYITELVGICFIHAGYQVIKASAVPSVFSTQGKHSV